MHGEPDLARIARALAEPARADMVLAVLDGQQHPVGELAGAAGVAPATATEHVRELADAGIVAIEPRGRQRLVALSGADVARAIEALTEIAPAKQVRGLAGTERNNALRTARTCYDHPAGALGVALTARLVDDGIVAELEPGTIGTMLRTGHPTLDSLGVTIPTGGRRPTVRSCLDWTERRPHVAGALGRAVLDALVEGKWVSRRRDTRALRVTPSGADRLGELLGDWTPAGT
ncbi:MAG: ArsR/SmtB family transcription factor [Acidimicrobiia bacterium]